MRTQPKISAPVATVFTDGGCIKNPGPGGWAAIIQSGGRVRELGGGEAETTNNRMEMLAVIRGLSSLQFSGEVLVVTDSRYVIDGASKWIRGWKKNGWRKSDGGEVLNRDLWEEIDGLTSSRRVLWEHIRGHTGHPQNERCDFIANSFARGQKPELYEGDGSWIAKKGILAEEKYEEPLYLSFIDGAIEEHRSWAECEARIRGVRGSKCKKVLSKSEHIETIAKWGDQ